MSLLNDKFQSARKAMSGALIERDAEIDLGLVGLLAGEHVLLVGKPGLAKSLLLDSLVDWLGGRKFKVLLHNFTDPNAVFGPLSLPALREEKYRRCTAGYLPEADFCYLDEIWKASPAILNTLLNVLCEGIYVEGDVVRKVPLKLAVASSNEWPSPETGKTLAAIFDRFLLRREVRPIATAAGEERLMWSTSLVPTMPPPLQAGELEAAKAEAAALPIADEAKDAYRQIKVELNREGIFPGDRRRHKSPGVARATAWLSGAARVEPAHLEVLAQVLWEDPGEQAVKAQEIVCRVANPTGHRVSQLLVAVEDILANVKPTEVASAVEAAKKLEGVHKDLKKLGSDSRVKAALAYVKDRRTDLLRQSAEDLDD